MPQMGAVLEEQDDPAIRDLPYGNFRIIYRLEGKRITILTVQRGARELDPQDLTE